MTHAHVAEAKPNRQRDSARTARGEPARGEPGAPQRSVGRMPPAVAGLVSAAPADAHPVVRRDFDFVGKGVLSEPFRFEADVAEAIERSKTFGADIAAARKAVTALRTASVRDAGLKELDGIEQFVRTWDGVKVPLDKRAEVVKQVAATTARLSAIAADYAKQDTQAIAEATRLAKAEAARLKKEQDDERKRQEAERKRLEEQAKAALEKQAQQKIADDRSTLDDRKVLADAQAAAKSRAELDTANAQDAYARAGRAAERRGATKSEKEAVGARKAELDAQVAESTNRSMGALAEFARSPEGLQLSEADLRLVIQTAGADPQRARAMVDVLNASGADRTVARGFAGVGAAEFAVTAAHCVALLRKGVPAAAVLAGAREMVAHPDVRAFLDAAAGPTAARYLTVFPITAPHALKAALVRDLDAQPPSAYTPHVAQQLLGGLAAKTVLPQTVAWLTGLRSTAEFAGLVALCIDPSVDVQALRAVFGASTYTAAETLGLCQRHKADLPALTAAVAEVQPGCPGYTDLVMATRHLVAFSAPQQRAALRAEALLAAGQPAVTVRILRGPGDYGRGPDNTHQATNIARDAKTGFVQLSFQGRPETFEIHTHWFQADGQGAITSMHVVAGGQNGIEIQTRAETPLLVAAVVALHNGDRRYPKPQGQNFHV